MVWHSSPRLVDGLMEEKRHHHDHRHDHHYQGNGRRIRRAIHDRRR